MKQKNTCTNWLKRLFQPENTKNKTIKNPEESETGFTTDEEQYEPEKMSASSFALPQSVELFATGTLVGNDIKYTLDADSIALIKDAAVNNLPFAGTVLNCTYTPSEGETIKRIFVSVHNMHKTATSKAKRFELSFMRMEMGTLYRLDYNVSISPTGIISSNGQSIETPIEIGDYLSIRHNVHGSETFDMNDFQKSGGISIGTSGTLVVHNLPNNVTVAEGYVLGASTGCIQVITDVLTDKTYTRRYGLKMIPTPSTGWTEWKETGSAQSTVPLLVQATYTVDATDNRAYTFDNTQDALLIDYIENKKTNPVLLTCTDASNPAIYETFVCTALEHTKGDANDFIFYQSRYSGKNDIHLNSLRLRLLYISSLNSYLSADLTETNSSVYDSEYKFDRYVPIDSYDMNDFTESGGITGFTDPEIVSANVPEGFTNFYGYVLKSSSLLGKSSCTQIITDSILKKTMMRNASPSGRIRIWTEWTEIGKNNPDVYLVSEYPADLTDYAEGSIFIKQ